VERVLASVDVVAPPPQPAARGPLAAAALPASELELERGRGARIGAQMHTWLGVVAAAGLAANVAAGNGLKPVGTITIGVYAATVAVLHRRRAPETWWLAFSLTVVPLVLAANLLWGRDVSRMLLVAHVFYVAWFGPPRAVAAVVAFDAVAFALALHLNPEYGSLSAPAATWVSTTGVLATVAVVVGRLRERSDTQLRTVLTLARMLDLRDTGTASHSATVARYAMQMGRSLGLPERRVSRLALAGVLHDIGKVAVSDATLRKPGPLDDDEWAEMRRHPDVGADLLDEAGLDDIAAWVRMHHERPDGRGYPSGLSAGELPLEARILSVADAFEAMTADRPHRAAMSFDQAVAQLRANAGTQFDAEVVDAFVLELNRQRRSGSVPD
jgi:putative nucleotidyltransferase with HDIG domain